jgi:hypothetical protein
MPVSRSHLILGTRGDAKPYDQSAISAVGEHVRRDMPWTYGKSRTIASN